MWRGHSAQMLGCSNMLHRCLACVCCCPMQMSHPCPCSRPCCTCWMPQSTHRSQLTDAEADRDSALMAAAAAQEQAAAKGAALERAQLQAAQERDSASALRLAAGHVVGRRLDAELRRSNSPLHTAQRSAVCSHTISAHTGLSSHSWLQRALPRRTRSGASWQRPQRQRRCAPLIRSRTNRTVLRSHRARELLCHANPTSDFSPKPRGSMARGWRRYRT